MNNKTMYRITLFPDCNLLCQDLAVMAAKSNGNDFPAPLKGLEYYFLEQQKKYPTANGDMTFEIIGEHLAHIDRKVGDNWVTVMILEQVEILDVPTLSYQNGIANPEFMECIN